MLPARFWEKVEKRADSECWIWRGSRDQKGYGMFRFRGRVHRAHRLVIRLRRGEIARHRCDNPPCCNPRHVVRGNARANVQDCIRRGRRADYRGTNNNQSKLTARQVRVMRKSYAALPRSPKGYTRDGGSKALATRFGISYRNLMQIVKRITWQHI